MIALDSERAISFGVHLLVGWTTGTVEMGMGMGMEMEIADSL